MRILSIQDISCVGRCSLTVALPIISACGIETAILPSAVLSTHTGGFSNMFCRDLSDDIEHIYKHWIKEGIDFSAIYTGYLANKKQIDYVIDIMNSKLLSSGAKIVDPAMADHGKLYTGFDNAHVEEMSRLCTYADIILPNITEACFIAKKEYREKHDENYVKDLLSSLSSAKVKFIVLKGIDFDDGELGIAVYDVLADKIEYHFHERIAKNYHGTGDCFASGFTALYMRGFSVYEAAKRASSFVLSAIKHTDDSLDGRFGVCFEQAIPDLIQLCNS